MVEERHVNLNAQVLMNENLSSWEGETLEGFLQPCDRWKLLAQIRVRPNVDDKPFWPRGKFNMYSVKTGYMLASEMKQRDVASSSSSSCDLWNWIWNLDVIPKVKLFLWRCIANALPTAKALRSRTVEVDILCRRCGECEESIEHAIRDCGWVTVLWAVSPLRLRGLTQGENCTIVDWFEKIRACPEREVHAMFATIAWVCWYARNLLMFQNKVLSHVDCLGIATRAQWVRPAGYVMQRQSLTRLECSEDGVCKVSTDAAFKVGSGVGIGAVLKHGDDSLLGCRFGFSAGAFAVIEGEALALLEGLKLCREKGVMDVIAETDSQQLYWKLVRHESDLSYLGDTLGEIFDLINSFHRVRFSWTPREGNSIADKLASFALSSLFNVTSFEVLPSVLNSVLAV